MEGPGHFASKGVLGTNATIGEEKTITRIQREKKIFLDLEKRKTSRSTRRRGSPPKSQL